MAGIYIHIPFCIKKCSYCDFYKSTKTGLKSDFIQALLLEIESRKAYLGNQTVETIYVGGGTPSVLSVGELGLVFKKLFDLFEIDRDAEISLEANPDDLTHEYLADLINTPVNRLSIGIQSFSDESLRLLGRRHDANRASRCVGDAYRLGFENISIDLIYGLPNASNETWAENLRKAFILPIKHLSAYHLTYHNHTLLNKQLEAGTICEIAEDDSFRQFEMLAEVSHINNFDQYEISNFAKEGRISKHNFGYWFGESYLGVGPSAHSYNQNTRSWNIQDLGGYIKRVKSGEVFFETEILSEKDKFNDYIITRLRTKWGICKNEISEKFGGGLVKELQNAADKYIVGGLMDYRNGNYTLNLRGLFISDKIMGDLIQV